MKHKVCVCVVINHLLSHLQLLIPKENEDIAHELFTERLWPMFMDFRWIISSEWLLINDMHQQCVLFIHTIK